MLLLSLLAAFANELSVEVLPDSAGGTASRRPVRARPIPLPRAPVEVDGVREPAWDAVPPTDLHAFADGPAPSPADVRWAFQATGVVAWVTHLPDHETTLAVDPDGAGHSWVRVTLGEAATAWSCVLPEAEVLRHPIGLGAVPCDRTDAVEAVRSEQGWELRIPWSTLRDATFSMRLLTRVDGPGRAGATNAVGGGRGAVPAGGVGIVRASPRIDARLEYVGADATPTLSMTTRAPDLEPIRWDVTAWDLGTPVQDQATLALDEDLSTSTPTGLAPAPVSPRVTVRASGRAHLLPGFVVRGPPAPEVRVRTPVVDEALVLSWRGRNHRDTLALTLRDPDGDWVRTLAVSLPTDRGLLRISLPDDAPRHLVVAAEPGLPPTPLVRP